MLGPLSPGKGEGWHGQSGLPSERAM